MSQNIVKELQILLYAVLFGGILTAAYDIFRILRRVFPHRDLLVSLEDLVFWVFCAVSVFYLLNAQSDGKLRWFFVLGAALGMSIYHVTFGRLFVPFFSFLFGKCWQAMRFVLHYLLLPVKITGTQSRRQGQRAFRFLKKQLTVSRKMLKMMLHKQ